MPALAVQGIRLKCDQCGFSEGLLGHERGSASAYALAKKYGWKLTPLPPEERCTGAKAALCKKCRGGSRCA